LPRASALNQQQVQQEPATASIAPPQQQQQQRAWQVKAEPVSQPMGPAAQQQRHQQPPAAQLPRCHEQTVDAGQRPSAATKHGQDMSFAQLSGLGKNERAYVVGRLAKQPQEVKVRRVVLHKQAGHRNLFASWLNGALLLKFALLNHIFPPRA